VAVLYKVGLGSSRTICS